MTNNWEQDIRSGDLIFYGGSGKSLGCFIFESERPRRWGDDTEVRLISFSLKADTWDPGLRRQVTLEQPVVVRHVTIATHGKRAFGLQELPPCIVREPRLYQAYLDEQERLRHGHE